jgi:hypothetical protein
VPGFLVLLTLPAAEAACNRLRVDFAYSFHSRTPFHLLVIAPVESFSQVSEATDQGASELHGNMQRKAGAE